MGSDQSTPITATIELKLGAEEDTVTIREVNTNGGNIRKELNNCDGRNHRSNGGVIPLNLQQRSQGQARAGLNPQQRSQGQAQDGQPDHRPNVGFRAGNSQQRIPGQGNGNITRDANRFQMGRHWRRWRQNL